MKQMVERQKILTKKFFDERLHRRFITPSESALKRHLDRFSRFCRAHPCPTHARERYVRHV